MKEAIVLKAVIGIMLIGIIITGYGGICSSSKHTTSGSSGVAEATGITDTAFANSGVVTSVFGTNSVAYGLAIQPDGKIIAAGYSFGINMDFAVARYSTNGALDNAFGTGGVVTNVVGASHDEIRSVMLQDDGAIVAGGNARFGPNYIYALARYTSAGALDNTFGIGGIITATIGANNSSCYGLALQADDKIIAAGESHDGAAFYFTVARYGTNGTLDNTFGIAGVITTSLLSGDDQAMAVDIQGDGKILAAGTCLSGTDYYIGLARYGTTGVLDGTFGIGGVVTTTFATGNDDEAFAVEIQSDGKIVVAGASTNAGGNASGLVARYNTDGTLDNTFGTGGVITTSIATYTMVDYYSLALQDNGKIVVGGRVFNGSRFKFVLARYTSSGALDTTFGTNGIILAPIDVDSYGNDIKIQSDGKIVIGGVADDGPVLRFGIIRYK
jgi:uncharacterized delta-60 repeat protein